MTSDNTSLKTNSQKHLCVNKKNFIFDVDKKICATLAPDLFSSFMLVSVPLTPLSTFLDRWIFGEILCKFLPASQVGQLHYRKDKDEDMDKDKDIPDICHERHEHARVNFFWPV